MRRFILRVFEVYSSFKFSIAVIFFLLVVIQGLSLIGLHFVGLSFISFSTKSFDLISHFASLSLLTGFIRVTVQRLKDDYELDAVDFKVRRALARKTLDKILTLSVGQLRSEHSGLTHSIINRGEHSLSALAFTFVYEICPIFCRISLVSLALFWLSWQLCLVIFIGGFSFLFLTWYINKKFWPEIKEIETASHENEKSRNEIIRNIVLVILSAVGLRIADNYISDVKKTNDKAVSLYLKYHVFSYLRNAVIVLTQFAIVYVGGYYVSADILQPGGLITFVLWSQMVFGDINNLGALHKRCIDLAVSVNKYFQLLDVPSAVKESANPVILEKLSGNIEFKNVSFKYPRCRYIDPDEDKDRKTEKDIIQDVNQDALSNVNISIKAGEKVAIVGRSGAGKTTIVNLLLRGYDPDEGEILVDGLNLKHLSLDSYRSKVGLVEQNISLFDDTLRRNITFGLDESSGKIPDSVLLEVAKTACIDKFFGRLTDQFETKIGENGTQLSGGERQRVGIARALIKNPSILILDEPTSSLDSENEALIKQSIDKTSKGRTTIIIAHRLSTIRDADKIIVMDKGSVVGVGRHEDLLHDCEVYGKLIEAQMFF